MDGKQEELLKKILREVQDIKVMVKENSDDIENLVKKDSEHKISVNC